MQDSLLRLKNIGYSPTIIFDIGACVGNWTKLCLYVYPNSMYYLFEPIEYSELKTGIFANNLDFSIIHKVLSDTEKVVDWYELKNTGDSVFKENSLVYKDCIPVKKNTTTLNNLFKNRLSYSDDIFMKIDTQGSELSIIAGASEILKFVSFILIEMPLFGKYNIGVASFCDHIKTLDDLGYVPFDICEKHINEKTNFTNQVDMLFIKKTHKFNIDAHEKNIF